MYLQNADHQKWLEAAIATLGAMAGTVHVQRDTTLHLTAAHHIPVSTLTIITRVAYGKGMSGLAQSRKKPVQQCDLLSEAELHADPKPVTVHACIAMPLLDAQSEVLAVIGFAFEEPGDLDEARQQTIAAVVQEFASHLKH
ncbi:MAG: hypothetical protein RL748_1821 [Pseudomonadota bacterium]|jgi:putative methionine-R-sulfoxide reductase with GAF domain